MPRFAQGLVAAFLSLPAARDDHALARAVPTLKGGGARPLSPRPHFPHACPPVQAPVVPGQRVQGPRSWSPPGAGLSRWPKAQGRPVQVPATSSGPGRGRKNQAGVEAKGRLSRQILPKTSSPLAVPEMRGTAAGQTGPPPTRQAR
ncbi:MAG: hypothetical protein LBL95_09760 [Deltaproteobacteria bacterium]|nr:hypothetical protein [Deltaproteobacteria bacterium]